MQNTSTVQYFARSKWSAERLQTLVVCCSDGRWHAPILEFVHHEASNRADLYAVPGGPAVVDPWSSSFEEARNLARALQLSEDHHDLTQVSLIQHPGCAYYRVRYSGHDPAAIRERQIADLHRRSRA